MSFYAPDFEEACRICGTSPCVVVVGHEQPDTELCGIHFFNKAWMQDWETWNEIEEED